MTTEEDRDCRALAPSLGSGLWLTAMTKKERNDTPLSLRDTSPFCSATLQGRAHEAKASHYISKHFCHCEAQRAEAISEQAPQ